MEMLPTSGGKTGDNGMEDPAQEARSIRIVVADAQHVVYEGIRAWLATTPQLRATGHATTGNGLLALLEEVTADLVLMDVSLPGRDGIDTMREMRKRGMEVPVLAYSALTEIEYVNSMLIEGANGYLVKGGVMEELIEAVETVLGGRCYISAQARSSVDAGYQYCDKRMGGEYVGLSEREREIIRLVALERTNDEIAAALFISRETVKTHRKNLMAKLNVRSVAGLVRYAHGRRWV